MSRCRACNAVLSEYDLRRTNEEGDPEDFCIVCRGVSDNPDSVDWKFKQFEDEIKESRLDLNLEYEQEYI